MRPGSPYVAIRHSYHRTYCRSLKLLSGAVAASDRSLIVRFRGRSACKISATSNTPHLLTCPPRPSRTPLGSMASREESGERPGAGQMSEGQGPPLEGPDLRPAGLSAPGSWCAGGAWAPRWGWTAGPPHAGCPWKLRPPGVRTRDR